MSHLFRYIKHFYYPEIELISSQNWQKKILNLSKKGTRLYSIRAFYQDEDAFIDNASVVYHSEKFLAMLSVCNIPLKPLDVSYFSSLFGFIGIEKVCHEHIES